MDALGIGKYMNGNNDFVLNPKKSNGPGQGDYAVYDYGKDRATWFVGYTFTNMEKKNVLPKLKARAKSLGLHFVWPYPGQPNKINGGPDEGTVWMKVMGDWEP